MTIGHEMQEITYQQDSAEEETVQEQQVSSRTNRLIHRSAISPDLMKAHITLMEREVILSKQGDLFRLVQHHYHKLQTWHDQHTGWRIQRSSTVIRLVRHMSSATPGYLYERLKEPKDFACLTWILWYAENRQLTGRGNEQQFLLSQLADQIQEQSSQGTEEGAQFDFRRPADRYSIQRALQYLEDMGGLQLVDGQTREWIEQTGNADVLYEFTDAIRSLVAALNPHVVEEIATYLSEPAIILQPSLLPSATTTPALLRAWRALLLGPALFRFDDPDAFSSLLAHADTIANELLDTFGWLLDIQRDYACIVRASGTSSAPVSPLTPYGTNDQIALLMCQAIRNQVATGAWPAPDSYGCLHVNVEDMADLFYSVRERYGENWGNEARSKSSPSLLNDVYRKMRQVGLLRGPDKAGNMLVLPTAARYSANYEKGDERAPTRSRSKKTSKQAAARAVELPGL
ncbi:MAG TPA: TIGR02678 family protein [Ktedonobacteraceae bacterium]|nr:TIGR02678 family protein [Ktedonobacteraceae bacterium]